MSNNAIPYNQDHAQQPQIFDSSDYHHTDEEESGTSAGSNLPIRDIFSRWGMQYVKDHAAELSEEQKKAAYLIGQCKKGEDLGANATYCPNCKKWTFHNNSCNCRSCSNCQSALEARWVEDRSAEVIDGIAYFHCVITIPHVLIPLLWENRDILFPLMLSTATDTYVMLACEKRWGGFTPQVINVLHTQGSLLQMHPHVHTICSGGGIDAFGNFIESSHKEFFIPESVISGAYRSSFLKSLQAYYDAGKLKFPQKQSYLENPEIWANFVSNLYKTKWVAFVKETFNGNGNAIRYLGRYMFRTAISNSRILEVDYEKETVTFKYKDHKDDDTWKVSTISAYEFIGRYLSHVLPKGVHRATYGGMLVNRKKEFFKRRVCQARNKMYLASYFKGRRKMADVMKYLYHVDIDICPHCGHKLIRFNWRDKRLRDFANQLGWRSLTTPPVIGDYQCQTAELGVKIFLKLFRSLRPEDFSQVFPDLCGDGFASDSRDTEELA